MISPTPKVSVSLSLSCFRLNISTWCFKAQFNTTLFRNHGIIIHLITSLFLLLDCELLEGRNHALFTFEFPVPREGTQTKSVEWMNEWTVKSSNQSSMKGRGFNPTNDIPTNESEKEQLSWVEYSVMRAKLLAPSLHRPVSFSLDSNHRPTVNSDQPSWKCDVDELSRGVGKSTESLTQAVVGSSPSR